MYNFLLDQIHIDRCLTYLLSKIHFIKSFQHQNSNISQLSDFLTQPFAPTRPTIAALVPFRDIVAS